MDFTLALSCPDRPGIVAAVSAALLACGADIADAQQYGDRETGAFFMRVAFRATGPEAELRAALAETAEAFALSYTLRDDHPRRVLILASRFDHCLADLLYRWRIGELWMDIAGVISNHAIETYANLDLRDVPFHHLPVTKDTKAQQEARVLEIVAETGTDLVVLARYMQVLSDDMSRALEGRCINIHHSFLPGFKGAKPYHQAHARGVKLIGATAHYVTADLDEGPIIEQDVARADHSKTVEDLTAMGRDTESQVLARAVKWHSEHRVLLNGHKTVIFK